MDAEGVPLIPMATRARLLNMLEGTYGISYDIFTWKTEDDLPDRWNTYQGEPCTGKPSLQVLVSLKYTTTAATYTELAKLLRENGFERLQYSDWVCDPTDTIDAYWTALSLVRI